MPTRIDQADGSFNSYITSTADYLAEGTPTNATRLNLPATQAAEWDTKRDNWVLIYAKYKDASKRTATVTAEKEAQKKAFTQFANPILTGLSVNPALNNDDRGVFHLPVRDTATERAEMEEPPFVLLLPMAGGNMKVKVRTTSDGNRSSMHKDANHVEMRYALVASGSGTTAPPPSNPTGPNPPTAAETSASKIPTTAGDCPNSKISTKAIFTVKVGAEHSGKRIYAFFRWVNATKDEHSSPFGMAVQSVVV